MLIRTISVLRPWRLAELVWPNVSGRQYPIHRRWLEVIPAEGRVWTPTLYMGLFPLVLALSRLRFRRGPIYERWLTWVAVLATVASFGYYGLGWLLAECRVDSGVGGPFGGLYWLMNLLLPGYLRFRYPAKLLVLAALAVSVLAAKGWDRTFAGKREERSATACYDWRLEPCRPDGLVCDCPLLGQLDGRRAGRPAFRPARYTRGVV